MSTAIDRIDILKSSPHVAGIDFVYVDDGTNFPGEEQQHLYVFFYKTGSALSQSPPTLVTHVPVVPSQITIYEPGLGNSLSAVRVVSCEWVTFLSRTVLHVKTKEPGDFSHYRFHLDDLTDSTSGSSVALKIDPYFNDREFSFKANCPSDLDCKPPEHECPPDDIVDYPVNYQARDFFSIRQALLDFASDRHPEWQDRLEADLGMMLVEIMAAAGDEFAYYQDRIARESYLETAAERRSLRRHARLVDYEISNGKSGTTWLDFRVKTGTVALPAGARIKSKDGSSVYEVGHGLGEGSQTVTPQLLSLDPKTGNPQSITYAVRYGANDLQAYQWDSNNTCLEVGATSLYVVRKTTPQTASPTDFGNETDLPLDESGDPAVPGKWILLQTDPADASVAPRSLLVHLIEVDDSVTDPLTSPITQLTKLTWDKVQITPFETGTSTPFEMEYATLRVHGNMVPATGGETMEAAFSIAGNAVASPYVYRNEQYSSIAVERQAPFVLESVLSDEDEEYDPTFLYSLPGSETRSLVWNGANAQSASPEVRVIDVTATKTKEWKWERSFIGQISSIAEDQVFTIDEGTWRRVTSYRRVDELNHVQEFDHYDYAIGRGATVRFGNGEFGMAPERNAKFRVVYRLGRGRADDVSSKSLTEIDDTTLKALFDSVSNPFGVVDAIEQETPEHVRLSAPHAFSSERFNAVIEEDYKVAVEKLDWVERAGAVFRWTGSWATLFATPDPRNGYAITTSEQDALQIQLDRYRLAGREAYGMEPKYADLNIEICICLEPKAYPGDVEAAVLEALFGHGGVRPKSGFFSSDQWTFGQPLKRASLEAAIQSAHGVRAVESICIARRGWFADRVFVERAYGVAVDTIIRVSNDRNHPEQGLVIINMEGGI